MYVNTDIIEFDIEIKRLFERSKMDYISKKTSIVIPVYNVAEFLKECVDSAVNQTYQNIEIILVDDGSTDSSGTICDTYQRNYPDKVKVIHQKNGGLSNARNTGLRNATGDFIYFLDSDDYIELDTIEFLSSVMSNDPDLDFVFFDACSFENNTCAPINKGYIRKYIYDKNSGPNIFYQLYTNREFVTCVQFLYFKKEFLIKEDLWFYDGILHEDGLFTVYAYMKAKHTKHVGHEFYHRRFRKNSIMTRKPSSRNFHGYYTATVELLELLKNYSNKSNEYEILQTYLTQKIQSIIQIYYQLDRKNRVKSKNEFCNLCNIVLNNGDIKSQSLETLVKSRLKTFIVSKLKHYLRTPYLKYKDTFWAKRAKVDLKQFCRKYNNDLINVKSHSNERKIIVLCTPEHGNLGDQAIAISQKIILKNNINKYQYLELTYGSSVENVNKMAKFIHTEDVFVVTGGGWLGTLWYHDEYIVQKYLKKYPRNKFIIMPQTVFYNMDDDKILKASQRLYAQHKNLFVFFRDENSYDFFLKHGFVESERAFYMPDLVCYYNYDTVTEAVPNQVGLCFRKDHEKTIKDGLQRKIEMELLKKGIMVKPFTTVLPQKIESANRIEVLKRFLDELKKNKLVITDRLHCMLFCFILGVPCIAFDNLSHKVSGVYEWIKECEFVILVDKETSIENLFEKINIMYNYNSMNKPKFSLAQKKYEFIKILQRILDEV